MFGNVYFRDHEYKMVTHARVFTLELKQKELSKEVGMYIVAQMHYFRQVFSYNNMASFEKIKDINISLPVTQKGEIDFDYMEKYIRELELARIRELVAYLEVCGFKDCSLSTEELSAIDKFTRGGVKHIEYKIDTLFKKMNLKFLKSNFDKLRDISKEQNKEYNIPLVNAKDGDNGIMYYGRETDFETTEMSIDIVNDGAVSTGNVYPQPQKTGVLYNAYLVKFKNYTPTEEVLIYCSASLQKSIKKKFGYDNKAGWNKVKEENIFLPIDDNGEIDYKFMETYIRAIEKQCIKNVIAWKDKIIQTTKEVVG